MGLHRDILGQEGFQFDGHFRRGCQKESIPSRLLTFLSMVMQGPDINTNNDENQACLTIGQLLSFNTVVRRCSESNHSRHGSREPPLPVYIGLDIHSKTRSKTTIQELSQLGVFHTIAFYNWRSGWHLQCVNGMRQMGLSVQPN